MVNIWVLQKNRIRNSRKWDFWMTSYFWKNESIKPPWSIKHPVSIKLLCFQKKLKLFVEWKGVPSEKSHKNSEASLPLFVLSPVHCDGIPTVFGESHTTHTDYLWSLHDSLEFTKWRYWDMCGLHHSKFWDVGSRKPCTSHWDVLRMNRISAISHKIP